MNIEYDSKSNLKTTNFNLNKENDTKIYEKDILTENKKKFYNNVEYKSYLLNIDSKYRNIIPKNIYKSNNNILPNNPINVTRNSGILTINYPNHNFNIGDTIIIQNVISNHKILNNYIFFFNQFPYMIIKINNHGIPLDYNNYYSDYQISIQIINDIGSNTNYSNIPTGSTIQ